jgi:hypothetical protein
MIEFACGIVCHLQQTKNVVLIRRLDYPVTHDITVIYIVKDQNY